MKLFDYIYFNFYRWYVDDNPIGKIYNPTGMVSFLFGICGAGWCFLVYILCLEMNHKKLPADQGWPILIGALIVALVSGMVDKVYQNKNRYLMIYNKYIPIVKHKIKGLFLSFMFIFLPFLLLILYYLIKTLIR